MPYLLVLERTHHLIKKLIWTLIIATIFVASIVLLSPKAHGELSYQENLNNSPYVESTHVPPTLKPAVALKAPNKPVLAFKSTNQANVTLGHQLALENGYSEADWQCLYTLGMRESGWSNTATNKSSGAYGIPQSLPASKLDLYGNRHDPTVQINWMIDYVENRYGSSCQALSHSYAVGWY